MPGLRPYGRVGSGGWRNFDVATPIGHSLAGAAVGGMFGPTGRRLDWRWYALMVFAANAPDLDFLPGLFVGDVNRYHQLYSHSFSAAFLFAAAVWMLAQRRGRRPGLLATTAAIAYLSHLLLDYFTRDVRAPYGIPLLWPFGTEHYMAPFTVFGGVRHGVPGQDLATVLRELASLHNVAIVGIEAAILLPVLFFAAYVRLKRSRRR